MCINCIELWIVILYLDKWRSSNGCSFKLHRDIWWISILSKVYVLAGRVIKWYWNTIALRSCFSNDIMASRKTTSWLKYRSLQYVVILVGHKWANQKKIRGVDGSASRSILSERLARWLVVQHNKRKTCRWIGAYLDCNEISCWNLHRMRYVCLHLEQEDE